MIKQKMQFPIWRKLTINVANTTGIVSGEWGERRTQSNEWKYHKTNSELATMYSRVSSPHNFLIFVNNIELAAGHKEKRD